MADSDGITAGSKGVYIDVHLQPGARRNRLMGRHGGALKIAVTAPPMDGRANQAVVKAIAELLGVPASDVSLVAGHTSRQKRLFARGIDVRDARLRVAAALNDTSVDQAMSPDEL